MGAIRRGGMGTEGPGIPTEALGQVHPHEVAYLDVSYRGKSDGEHAAAILAGSCGFSRRRLVRDTPRARVQMQWTHSLSATHGLFQVTLLATAVSAACLSSPLWMASLRGAGL